jgi:hypothetical protein
MAPKSSSSVDKTFGMKNKKGSKAQQQVKVIQQQQAMVGKSKEVLAKEKKREEEKRLKELAEKERKKDPLVASIVQPRVPFGVDPKTVTCAYWKAGICEKGNKCKYAHANEAARKMDKKDLYTDMREGDEDGKPGANGSTSVADDKKNDTMDKWDLSKLDSVIHSKHGNPKSTTDKVCKFFLQAVEDMKYGWFWECPNGQNCMYKHRLPPGFVLKSQKKELEAAEKANEISLEEFLESARHQLGSNLTAVTPESFAVWKKVRVDKKIAEEEALESKKKSQAQSNKMTGLSGRELFSLNPSYLISEDDTGDGGDEFDMHTYFKNWEQGRESDKGDGDDDDDVDETNDRLQDLKVGS